MSQLTINFYFGWPLQSSSECNERSLSELCPMVQYRGKDKHYLAFFSNLPAQSLTAGTVTIGTTKYLRMSWDQQVDALVAACKEYAKKKSLKFTAFIEPTKNQVPHLHMLIYNGYQGHFTQCFKHFGRHNTSDASFAPVKNVSKYIDYITKEQNSENVVITNIRPETAG